MTKFDKRLGTIKPKDEPIPEVVRGKKLKPKRICHKTGRQHIFVMQTAGKSHWVGQPQDKIIWFVNYKCEDCGAKRLEVVRDGEGIPRYL